MFVNAFSLGVVGIMGRISLPLLDGGEHARVVFGYCFLQSPGTDADLGAADHSRRAEIPCQNPDTLPTFCQYVRSAIDSSLGGNRTRINELHR